MEKTVTYKDITLSYLLQKVCNESVILFCVFFFLTVRTIEDLKKMKSGIENISETLQTLKVSPTKEDGQFPQTPAIK